MWKKVFALFYDLLLIWKTIKLKLFEMSKHLFYPQTHTVRIMNTPELAQF